VKDNKALLDLQARFEDAIEPVGDAPTSGNPVRRSLERFRAQVRHHAHEQVAGTFLRGLAASARLHPLANPARHNVEVLRDIPYLDDGDPDHTLDIYRPTVRPGPWPVVLYVHGGGFSLLSKETHWVMALIFARYGYLVFNISYRLAPRHPYPAAVEDTCAAYEWVVEHADRYGGDLSRLVVAGESAGANLITSLSVATSYRRPEPWARRAFDLGTTPKVAVPACGIFQVTDSARFGRRRRLPMFVNMVLLDVSHSYLRGVDLATPGAADLADPLLLLERGRPPDRPLPSFFVPIGTRDPLLDDTRRLKRALDGLGVPCEARYYPKEIHAFHAMIWRRKARDCWRDTLRFLQKNLAPGGARDDEDAA
jgi:acetyl esterase